MNKVMIGSLTALVLVAAACGDDGGGGSLSAARGQMLDLLLTEAAAEGMKIDEDCAAKVLNEISDEDVAKLLAAGPDGDADVSDETNAATLGLVKCVDTASGPDGATVPDLSIPEGVEISDAMVDAMVTAMESSGMKVDRDCVGEALEDMDLAEVAAQGSAPSAEFIQLFMGCMTP